MYTFNRLVTTQAGKTIHQKQQGVKMSELTCAIMG